MQTPNQPAPCQPNLFLSQDPSTTQDRSAGSAVPQTLSAGLYVDLGVEVAAKVAATAAKPLELAGFKLSQDSSKTVHSDTPHLDNTTLDHDHLLPNSLPAVLHRKITTQCHHLTIVAGDLYLPDAAPSLGPFFRTVQLLFTCLSALTFVGDRYEPVQFCPAHAFFW